MMNVINTDITTDYSRDSECCHDRRLGGRGSRRDVCDVRDQKHSWERPAAPASRHKIDWFREEN